MNASAPLLQAQSMSEGNDTEWSKNIVRITELAQDTAGSFSSQYNETAWFPVARNTFSHYMEVWASRVESTTPRRTRFQVVRFSRTCGLLL